MQWFRQTHYSPHFQSVLYQFPGNYSILEVISHNSVPSKPMSECYLQCFERRSGVHEKHISTSLEAFEARCRKTVLSISLKSIYKYFMKYKSNIPPLLHVWHIWGAGSQLRFFCETGAHDGWLSVRRLRNGFKKSWETKGNLTLCFMVQNNGFLLSSSTCIKKHTHTHTHRTPVHYEHQLLKAVYGNNFCFQLDS
jgi:hypothetical protein